MGEEDDRQVTAGGGRGHTQVEILAGARRGEYDGLDGDDRRGHARVDHHRQAGGGIR